MMADSAASGIPAAEVAAVVLHALASPAPRSRYAVGGRTAASLLMKRMLPDWLYQRVIVQYMQL
jgi:hypothetical protein